MAINAISFRGTELEAQKLEKVSAQPSVELKQENDKVELTGKKQKPVRSFWGTVGASLASASLMLTNTLMGLPTSQKMEKVYNLNDDEAKAMHNAVKQMNIDTGLRDKGVKIRFINPLKARELNINGAISENMQTLTKEEFVEKSVKFLEKIDRNFFDLINMNSVRAGKNAFYVSQDAKSTTLKLSECIKIFKEEGWKAMREKMKATHKTYIRANSVVLPKKGLEGSGFHELGHALNFKMSKIGKFLQKCRPVSMYVAPLLMTYGAITRASKPKEEGKELNGAQKTHNFVRDNAGKLAFASSLPMLIEEGMASIKGQKYAKKLLSPDLAKKVFKGNAIAYLSYLSFAVFSSLAAVTAVKVKDKAIDKKARKIEEKEAIAKQIEEELKANT